VQVWDAATGKLAYRYQGHSNEAHALAWSPNGIKTPQPVEVLSRSGSRRQKASAGR